jgi:hypothetical protein
MTCFEEGAQLAEGDGDQALKPIIGAKITAVAAGPPGSGSVALVADDGRTFKIIGNSGCGGCTHGWAKHKRLEISADLPAVVAAARVETIPPKAGHGPKTTRIWILGQAAPVATAEYACHDDNGFYGFGVWLEIEDPA